jgi:hypothetical protein
MRKSVPFLGLAEGNCKCNDSSNYQKRKLYQAEQFSHVVKSMDITPRFGNTNDSPHSI